MLPDHEKNLRAAARAHRNGLSVRAAAIRHGVSRTTLRRHMDGGISRREASQKRQNLSPTTERFLVRWVKLQTKLGYAPPHSRFRLFAMRLSQASGGPQTLGTHWVRRFLRRYPELKTLQSVRYDWRRSNAACSVNIVEFFDRLDDPLMSAIPPAHTYNADEIGMMVGIGDAPLVIGPSELKEVLINDPLNRDSVTIVECVSGDDRALFPLVIFGGKNVQQQWFNDEMFNDDDLKQWKFDSKALNSRLAMQADAMTADAPDRPKTLDRALQDSENHLQTPKNSKDLRELETSLLAEDGLPQTAGVRRMSRQSRRPLTLSTPLSWDCSIARSD